MLIFTFVSLGLIFTYLSSLTKNKYLLFLLSSLLILIVGTRGVLGNDTWGYTKAFHETPSIEWFSFDKSVYGYSEKGFFLLSSLFKTLSDNITVYF